jgi:DNA-binding Lrp family transcriptional regulator
VGLSSTACARRLKTLEESGLVAGYLAALDLKQLGFSTTVIVRTTLDSQSEEALNARSRRRWHAVPRSSSAC